MMIHFEFEMCVTAPTAESRERVSESESQTRGGKCEGFSYLIAYLLPQLISNGKLRQFFFRLLLRVAAVEYWKII